MMKDDYTYQCDKMHNDEVDWETRMDQARLIIYAEDYTIEDAQEALTLVDPVEFMGCDNDPIAASQLCDEAKHKLLDKRIIEKARELGDI